MTSRVVDRARFDRYLSSLAAAVGHADRHWPLEAYLTGSLLPGRRKSIEPIAARIDARHASRAHQAWHRFTANSPRDERKVLRVAREYALELVDGLLADDAPGSPVIADRGHGHATAFRDALSERGLCYVLAVEGDTSVRPPGPQPVRPGRKLEGGRPPTRLKRGEQHQPIAIERSAAALTPKHGGRCAGATAARAS